MKTQKCIHIDSRCDLHPNPECVYEKDGMMVAEDEEGCFEEYKKKGLIAKSANLICDSQIHNILSPSILSTVTNWTAYQNHDWSNQFMYNFTVIPAGTMVQIVSTRCNGISECWNNEDELKCGWQAFVNALIGNFKYLIQI